MTPIRIAMACLLAGVLPAAAIAQDEPIVVEHHIARAEIERILNADNLDTEARSPREVADAIALIPRGRAPDQFWTAYRRHVDAWQHLAELFERGGFGESVTHSNALIEAERAINQTFDEVERIARRHGARIPEPRTSLPPPA